MKKNIPSVSAIASAIGEDAINVAAGAMLLVWMAGFRRPDWPGTTALLGHVGVGKTTTALLISQVLAGLGGSPFERIREGLRMAIRGDLRMALAEAWRAACKAGGFSANEGMPVIHWLPYAAEPYDVRGAPRVVIDPHGRAWTVSAPPAEVLVALEQEGGIVLIDDLPLAPEEVQRSLLPLLGEGRLPAQTRPGESFRLRPGWRVVVTGNFPDQARGARPIPDAVRNRMAILRMEYGALPPETGLEQSDPATEERLARFVREQSPVWREIFGWHPVVVAFLELHPVFSSPAHHPSVLAFPSLRTLGVVSDLWWTLEGILPEVTGAARARLESFLQAAVLGLIGAEAGEALLAFWKTMTERKLPTPLDIMEAGGRLPVPEGLDTRQAFYLVRAAEAAIRLSVSIGKGHEGQALSQSIWFLLRLADAFSCQPETLGPVDQIAAALSSLARGIPGFWERVRAAAPEALEAMARHPGLSRILG